MPRKPKPQPDQVSLEIAYRKLQTPLSFEQVMKSRKLKGVLMRLALAHMKKRDQFDPRKAAAHDYD